MCYQCATNAENTVLRAHFAFMAMRSGVSLARLIQVTDMTSTGGGESAAEDAAIAFAQAARYVCAIVRPIIRWRILERHGMALLLLLLLLWLRLWLWLNGVVLRRVSHLRSRLTL